jgi:hypothetical protein
MSSHIPINIVFVLISPNGYLAKKAINDVLFNFFLIL